MTLNDMSKARLWLGIDIVEGDVATCPWMCKVQPAKRRFQFSGSGGG
jgi:hypothetical protein